MKKQKTLAPGEVDVPGVGVRKFKQWCMKSYYYRITIPQDIDANATIGLFCGHIGDKEWTNFERACMLPVGHEALIYRVSLIARPEKHTFLIDVMRAVLSGHLTILTDGEEFISEPLFFFAVNLFGEMTSREKDPLARLALETQIATNESGGFKEVAKWISRKISGIAIPLFLPESCSIDGHIDLEKKLYGVKPFGLYVVLHTITQKPLRDRDQEGSNV